jgi:hypothetical protein
MRPASESFPVMILVPGTKETTAMAFLDLSFILYALFGIGILGVLGAAFAVRFL